MDHLERIAKLRKVTLDCVDRLDDVSSSLDAVSEEFKSALQAVKSDTRTFASASRPRGMALAGPGFEALACPGLLQDEGSFRRKAAVEETRRALGGERWTSSVQEDKGEKQSMLVKEEEQGKVLLGRDRADSFVCVVKLNSNNSGEVDDVFILRSDEKPGKNFCNRQSEFAHWRKMTRLLNEELSSGRISTPADVWNWCQQL